MAFSPALESHLADLHSAVHVSGSVVDWIYLVPNDSSHSSLKSFSDAFRRDLGAEFRRKDWGSPPQVYVKKIEANHPVAYLQGRKALVIRCRRTTQQHDFYSDFVDALVNSNEVYVQQHFNLHKRPRPPKP